MLVKLFDYQLDRRWCLSILFAEFCFCADGALLSVRLKSLRQVSSMNGCNVKFYSIRLITSVLHFMDEY